MRERPLSPHLQIYKPQITSILSILHRATGVALATGLTILCWGLWAMSKGASSYECFQWFIHSPIGILMLLGWAWALCYHLLNGIRHLFWDMGYGFNMTVVNASGWVVIVFSFLLAGFFILPVIF